MRRTLGFRLPCSWPEWFEDWMGERFNASHDLLTKDEPKATHLVNGAVPGTYSSYMAVCYNIHVPQVSANCT